MSKSLPKHCSPATVFSPWVQNQRQRIMILNTILPFKTSGLYSFPGATRPTGQAPTLPQPRQCYAACALTPSLAVAESLLETILKARGTILKVTARAAAMGIPVATLCLLLRRHCYSQLLLLALCFCKYEAHSLRSRDW